MVVESPLPPLKQESDHDHENEHEHEHEQDLDEHLSTKIVKKRQRLTLVCLPCRKKKVKCDKGKPCSNCSKSRPEECIYDERKFEPKKRKRNFHKKQQNQHQPLIQEQLLQQQQQQHQSEGTDTGKQQQQHEKPSSSAVSKQDVCVLVQKSELEQLQAKLKYYENLSASGNLTNSSSQEQPQPEIKGPPFDTHSSITSIQNEPTYDDNDDIVYNKSINTYRNVVFSDHDELRPGFIPLENVASDNVFVYNVKNSTVTSTLHLSRLSSANEYLIGVNPYNNPNDVIDFYEDIPNVFGRYNRGAMSPLSSTYSIRSSSASRSLRTTASLDIIKANERKVDAGITFDPLKKLILPDDEKVKSMLHLDRSLESRFQEKVDLSEDDKLNKNIPPVNMRTFAMGLSILGGNKDRESSLIEQIQNDIPPKKVIWLLIQRYFSLLYPLIPYVIEDKFRQHTEKLIGKESYEDVKPEVKIENRVDIAHLGILFVICRLLYLSLFHNRGFYNEQILTKQVLTPEEEERKYLILNAINTHVVEIAQACFIHLQRLGRITFPLLQLGIFLRSYRVYAPEEGDGIENADSFVQHGTLVSMCYLLGLNRDPDKLPQETDEKVKNLYRKVWYFELLQEYSQAHTYGTPLYIRPESYDTKRPFFTVENANCRNLEVEKASISIFAFITSLIRGPIKDIVLLCNKIGDKVKILELTSHINHLEKGVSRLLGKVSDYIYNLEEKSSDYHTNKIIKIGSLFRINSLLMLLYCHLFNYYDKKNIKLAFFYLKKLFALAISEMLPYVFSLITQSQELFGEAADLSINPSIILFLVRLTDVCLSSLMRSNFTRLKMSNDPDHNLKISTDPNYKKFFESTSRFTIAMEKTVRVCLTACSILSSRYYFAWITIKLRNYFLKLVTSPNLYKMNIKQDLQFTLPSDDQIFELAVMTEKGMDKVESFINSFCNSVNIQSLFKKNRSRRNTKSNKSGKSSLEQQKSLQQQPTQFQSQHQQVPVSKPPSTSTYEAISSSNRVSPSINNFTEESPTPLSVDSNNSGWNGGLYATQFEDLTFDNGAEIDSIWLQMLNLKTFNQNEVFNGVIGESPPNVGSLLNINIDSNSNIVNNNNNGVNTNGNDNNNQYYGNPGQQFNGVFEYPKVNQQFDSTPNIDNNATNNVNPNSTSANPTSGSIPNQHEVYFDLFGDFPLNTLLN